jgi:serine protease
LLYEQNFVQLVAITGEIRIQKNFQGRRLSEGRIVKRTHLLTVTILLGLLLIRTATGQDQIFEKRLSRLGLTCVPGEIIVKFKPQATPEIINLLNSEFHTYILYTSQVAGFYRLKIPADKTVEEMAATYTACPYVEYAEANYIAYALMVPNDPLYSYQWHLKAPEQGGIGTEYAWDVSIGSQVIIAVLDTGIAYENYREPPIEWSRCYEQAPDLAQTLFVPGYDFVNKDEHPNDDSNPGHGTHIAGIIAQTTNNHIGTAGIAYGAYLMPVKVLDSSGTGTYADVAEGIIWATNQGAHIINLSLGGSQPSKTLENAVDYAFSNGVILVAAAGNDGTSAICYPAAYDERVIAVGATRYDQTATYYSNYGPSLDLMAPGGDLSVDQNQDGHCDGILQQTYEKTGCEEISWGYCFMEGTSMAAAQVSAVAALLIAEGIATSPTQVTQALVSTAQDKGPAGWDPKYGWGIVDANAACRWVPSAWPPRLNAEFVGVLTTGALPLTVQFTDKSSGQIIGWLWDFGDGETSTLHNPSHTYQRFGIYAVSLTVTAADGSDTEIKQDYITVTIPGPPEADFVALPTKGNAALTVQFTDKSACYAYFYVRDNGGLVIATRKVEAAGHITNWSWDFGDGGKATEQNPSHVYDQPGYYTVSLTVTSSAGSDTATKTDFIHATPPPPPVADFAAEPNSGDVPLAVQFIDQSVGDVTNWLWNFGDGQTSTKSNPSHTYQDPGDYSVSLNVTGRGGSDAETKAKYIHVTLPKAYTTISMTELRSFWGRKNLAAAVTIRADGPEGSPIEGLTVQGHWSGDKTSSVSGTTGKNGKITFMRALTSKSGTFTFTVDKVTKGTQQYDVIGQTSNSINL